jgi:hypothetical protein
MTGKQCADISKKVVDLHKRTGALEENDATRSQQIAALEKKASDMSGLPARVEALERSVIREVDGLREQQKSHQETTSRNMIDGFASISTKVDESVKAIGEQVKTLAASAAARKSIRDFLQTMAQIALGAAMTAEAVKVVYSAIPTIH